VVDKPAENGATHEKLAMPHDDVRLVASLQCFARYADDPELNATKVAIYAISLRRIMMQSVSDLRTRAIVRLHIPAIGWRHIEICSQSGDKADCRILSPLLPHELQAAKNSATASRDASPPAKETSAAARARRTNQSDSRSRSTGRHGGRLQLIPGSMILNDTPTAAMARGCPPTISGAHSRARGTA
jgi:hypothetical protein